MIDDESNQLGIMPPFEALKIARETLDLVEVSPTAQPPVCRIMDYGKYLYQQEKREAKPSISTRSPSKKSSSASMWTITTTTRRRTTCCAFSAKATSQGDDLLPWTRDDASGSGPRILDRLIKDLGDKAIVEFRPRQEGNTLHLILAPPKEQKPAGKGEKHEKPEKSDKPQKSVAPQPQPPAPAPPQQQQ